MLVLRHSHTTTKHIIDELTPKNKRGGLLQPTYIWDHTWGDKRKQNSYTALHNSTHSVYIYSI